jgi:4-alpha-glucanotransferase
VGGFGHALAFIDWLADLGLHWWQLLPLQPTTERWGNSPYSPASAFALDPVFVDLDDLSRRGLLPRGERMALPGETTLDDSPPVVRWKTARARADQALARAWAHAGDEERAGADAFARTHAWVGDWARYTALTREHGGTPWPNWSHHEPERDAVARAVFEQWILDEQWTGIRAHARARNVKLFGDVPMYVVADACDPWAWPEGFALDVEGRPSFEAGVPPDAFSADGQRWSTPTLRWPEHERDDFNWWRARIRTQASRFDLVRLDHFRGFSAHWRIPGDASSAREGAWIDTPGPALFEALERDQLLDALVAEDLGLIDEPVRALLGRFGLPGMRVARFAFGPSADVEHAPDRAPERCVAYTTTHDNLPFARWFGQLRAAEQTDVASILGVDSADPARAAIALCEQVLRSPARLAIVAAADASCDPEAVVNRPGRPDGNWTWRATTRHLQTARRVFATNLESRR